MKVSQPQQGSPSRTETAARCHRRHFAGHVVEVRPPGGEPQSTAFGTVMHAGVAEYWGSLLVSGYQSEGSLNEALATIRHAYHSFEQQGVEFDANHTQELAEGLMRYYAATAKLASGHWAAGVEGWGLSQDELGSPLLEQRMEVPTPGGWRLRFMLDRVVRNEERDFTIAVDLKTAAYNKRTKTPQFYGDWESQWEASVQQRLYLWGLRASGVRVDEMWVEGLLKHLPSQLRNVRCPDWSDEALDEAVMLFERVCNEDARLVELAVVDGVVDLDRLYEVAVTQTSYNLGDCNMYYSKCPLWDVCRAEPAQRAAMLRTKFEAYEGDW